MYLREDGDRIRCNDVGVYSDIQILAAGAQSYELMGITSRRSDMGRSAHLSNRIKKSLGNTGKSVHRY